MALRAAGAPADLAESLLAACAARAWPGVRACVFAATILEAGPDGVRMHEAPCGPPRLGRLAALTDVADAVADGRLSPEAASARVASITSRRDTPPLLLLLGAEALAAGVAAAWFGGGWAEVGVAAVAGLLASTVALVSRASPRAARLADAFGAVVAVLAVRGAAHLIPGLACDPATIGGLIGLLPGYTLTVAMSELSGEHAVSGTARLVAGVTTLLQLALGLVVADHLAAGLLGPLPAARAHAEVAWNAWALLVPAACAFAVLLEARLRDIPFVLLACATALAGERLGDALGLGPLAGGVGSLLLTIVANRVGRSAGTALLARPPAAVLQAPGLLLLVPGTTALRAVEALLSQETTTGVELAFRTALAAAALVAGTILGSAFQPARAVRTAPLPQATPLAA